MSQPVPTVTCQTCQRPIDPSGPAISEGIDTEASTLFVPFVGLTEVDLGDCVHLDCFVSRHGTRALAELMHAPRAAAANNE